jgi:Transglycosylase SLT domain
MHTSLNVGCEHDTTGTVGDTRRVDPVVRTAVPAEPEDVVATPPPRRRLPRIAYAVARAFADWARGSTGRLVLPALLVVAALALAGIGGGYLVPGLASKATAQRPATGDNAPGAPGESTPPDDQSAAPEPPDSTAGPADPEGGTGRPQAALAAWAAPLAAKLAIPVVAIQAYGYAELALANTQPACHLHWTTLAGIGKVESNHGQANATLSPDGMVRPTITGPPLDGHDGRIQLSDTDRGLLDNDTTWDRAVGPMQFIPLTWRAWAVDADGDGQADPNDINDAALAAGRYLCANGRDLSTADGWWQAVLSYNALRTYAQDVFDAADDYGRRSRR